MGTMHVQDNRAFTFAEMAIEKMRECNLYVGEMDLSNLDNASFQNAFLLEENQHLNKLFSEKKFKKFSHILSKSFGIDLNQYVHFAPMFIQAILSSKVLQNDYPYTLDSYLYQKAIELNLKTDGLETLQEQYEVAKKLNLKSQIKSLEEICHKPEKFRKHLLSMLNSYKKGEINSIYKKGKKSLGVNKKVLLYDRNAMMIERIISFIKDNNCFITVGAGHLAGDKGIISGIKKRGYTIRPLLNAENELIN
jgi:hypothetical protein